MIGWFPPMPPFPVSILLKPLHLRFPSLYLFTNPPLSLLSLFPRVKIVRTMVLKQDSHPDISMFKLSKFSCSF